MPARLPCFWTRPAPILAEARAIAPQLPAASSLPPGALVFVLGGAMRTRRGLRRLLGRGTVPVARAPRCAALVARGYTDVGALLDARSGADLVYGRAGP